MRRSSRCENRVGHYLKLAVGSCLTLLASTLVVAAPIDLRLIQAVKNKDVETARYPDVVKLLIDARADVRARSLIYLQTVVGEQTQRAGREELNYTVLRGGATPLLFAARVGDEASADLLLKAGADANDSQPDHVSALVLAAHSGHGH